jgi:hypothetical protein
VAFNDGAADDALIAACAESLLSAAMKETES